MKRKSPPRGRTPAVEPLESRQVLAAMLGLTAANSLVLFESDRPDLAGPPIPIAGLRPGESILAIDSRPATGQIYGLGSTGRFYTLDPSTGASTQVGNGPIPSPLSGSDFDIDISGNSDMIRLVSDAGMDLRIRPDTLAVTVDPNLAYVPTDPGAGTTPSIVAGGYAGGGYGALFEIDARRGALVSQGRDFGTSPVDENSGQLLTVASLGRPIVGPVGLDFLPTGVPLVSMAQGAGPASALYTFQTNNEYGPLTLVGNFPSSLSIRDISLLPTPSTIVAVTAANTLISFNSNAPGTVRSSHPILGLRPGETIAAIAFRPSTGALYGFGTTGRLYTINPSTSAAGAVSNAPISPAYDGTKPSIEFDAATDRVLLATKGGQDLRINPDTGAVDLVGAPLAYAPTDPAVGTPAAIVAQVTEQAPAHPSGTHAVRYGIDSTHDSFVSLDPPATGKVFAVSPLGLDVTDDAGFDVDATGPTLGSLTEAGATSSALYRLYPPLLPTPARPFDSSPLLRIGTIGGGAIVRDLAIVPAGRVQFSSADYTVDGDATSASILVVRSAGSSGPARVTYTTSDGTAVAGVNYTAVRGTIDFAEGELIKIVSIPLVPKSFAEGTRTINLTLTADAGSAIGVINSAVLTINASKSDATAASIQGAAFRGSATSITSADVTLTGAIINSTLSANPANYIVRGVTTDRKPRTVFLAIASATFDPTNNVVHLTFAVPVALRSFRSLQVTARGLGASGGDSTVSYSVLRGVGVRYVDGDGDRVFLGVIGRGAKVVVLRRADGKTASAWVEGGGRTVTGFVIPRRGSNRKTVIDRFVTNGARLRLPKSIQVAASGTVV